MDDAELDVNDSTLVQILGLPADATSLNVTNVFDQRSAQAAAIVALTGASGDGEVVEATRPDAAWAVACPIEQFNALAKELQLRASTSERRGETS